MKKIRTVAVFPTMFTLGNLICGFFAIVVASRVAPDSRDVRQAPEINADNPANFVLGLNPADPTHNVMLSGWLIFLAMIFDALDGHVARLAKITSDFGAQLDSLCDLVTFGVAPAFLMVKMCPDFTYVAREAMWIIAAVFTACAAIRLARFNVETETDDDHLTFIGLPTPAAAGCIAGFGDFVLHAAAGRESTAVAQRYRLVHATVFAGLHVGIECTDGFADSVSARGESIAQRASQLGARGGTAVFAGGNYRFPRLQRADYLLPVCAGSASPIRMAALAESATGDGAIVLKMQSAECRM